MQFELLDLDPCLRNHTPIFSGTPFRWTFLTYIVTMKYELYQNLGPLRSILRAPEHNVPGGDIIALPPPPIQSRANKHLMIKKIAWICKVKFTCWWLTAFKYLQYQNNILLSVRNIVSWGKHLVTFKSLKKVANCAMGNYCSRRPSQWQSSKKVKMNLFSCLEVQDVINQFKVSQDYYIS